MHKRLLFAKEGDAIWISHLDLMRVFQRAFRRAGMLLRHSQGYTPHAYVSILLPMSVGVSSQCEVLDYELDPGDTTPEAEIPAKLNACLPAGIRILASYESEKKAGKLGFLQARLDLEYDCGNAPACRDAIAALFQRPSLLLTRKTKRGEAEVDLLPMLRRFDLTVAGDHLLQADCLVCAQDPALNPQLLLNAIAHYLPDAAPSFAKIHRVEIFDRDGAVFR